MSPPIGDSIRRRQGGARRPPRAERPPVRWARITLFGLLAGVAAFGIGYAVAVLLLFPAPAADEPGIAVPSLVGRDSLSAGSALGRLGLHLGAVTPLPDPAAAAGTIVAQDALAGQQLRRGGVVNVAVSSGPARAVLPNVSGYAASRATALLGALGFQVSQQQAPDPAPAGRVVRVSPGPGLEYELPASVLLTVSAGPPPPDTTLLPDSTAAADSGRATPPGAPPAR